MTDTPKAQCTRCGDEGYVFLRDRAGYEHMYRCRCATGMAKPEKVYSPSDTERRYGVTIRLVPLPTTSVGRDAAAGKDKE